MKTEEVFTSFLSVNSFHIWSSHFGYIEIDVSFVDRKGPKRSKDNVYVEIFVQRYKEFRKNRTIGPNIE